VPRINIEDGLFRDFRFTRLIALLGDSTRALGGVVEAFILAQKYWVPNRHPIPKTQFDLLPTGAQLVAVGLARPMVDGIYICGSETQFFWMIQAIEAGRKGGEARIRNLQGKSSSDPQGTLKGLQPSSSSSFSNTNLKKETENLIGSVGLYGPAEPSTEVTGKKPDEICRTIQNSLKRSIKNMPMGDKS